MILSWCLFYRNLRKKLNESVKSCKNVVENVIENGNNFVQNERSLIEVMSEVLEESEYKKMLPIIMQLEEKGEITPRKAAEVSGKSAATARRYLSVLENSGYITAEGQTNNVVYKVTLR